MDKYRNLILISLTFIVITLLIVFSHGANLFWPLYFVPLFLAALVYGQWGGAAVGVLASVCLIASIYVVPLSGETTTVASTEFSVASGMMVATGLFFGWLFRNQKKRLAELSDASMLDRLTGLHNYGYFAERLEEERKRADRFGSRLALMMIDVDNFKPFNDRFGHASGNLMLKKLATVLEENVRDVDIACRYGGEEFAVILPNTEDEASAVAERIRSSVQDIGFEGDRDEPVVQMTVSVGVAVFPNACENELELIDCADRALNQAKESGRNKVVVFQES
jgi:diguanylate cyclase (GGDEF)-like protein